MNLENLKVQELSVQEQMEIDGGWCFWKTLTIKIFGMTIKRGKSAAEC